MPEVSMGLCSYKGKGYALGRAGTDFLESEVATYCGLWAPGITEIHLKTSRTTRVLYNHFTGKYQKQTYKPLSKEKLK